MSWKPLNTNIKIVFDLYMNVFLCACMCSLFQRVFVPPQPFSYFYFNHMISHQPSLYGVENPLKSVFISHLPLIPDTKYQELVLFLMVAFYVCVKLNLH